MSLLKYFLILIMALTISCGKSPLLNKKEVEVQGNSEQSAQKSLQISGSKLEINWLTPINAEVSGSAVLISSKNGVLVDLPSDPMVYLWMPTMNHGSSPIEITHLSTGIYRLSEIYFIMNGYWQLRIQLKSDLGTEEVFYEYDL